MKKASLSLVLLLVLIAAQAKTTYIPTYRSYIHIVTGGDTLSIKNKEGIL